MCDELQQFLQDTYGLEGTLQALYSYRDESFLLTNASVDGQYEARYVVKVMHPDTDPDVVDLQTTLLSTLGQRLKSVPDAPGIAQVVNTLNHTAFARFVRASGSRHLVWVVSYLEGVLAAEQQPLTTDTMSGLGRTLATLHTAMADVSHGALHRAFSWRLDTAEWIKEHGSALRTTYPDHAEWLLRTIDQFCAAQSDPKGLRALPSQPIHGDINEHNVLLTPHLDFTRQGSPAIAGIIDFGDAHKAPRVCCLAIAATYFMMQSPNPWKALRALVSAYHERAPLTPEEQTWLMPLVRMRLAQSLTQSMLRVAQGPTDDYVTVSRAPALNLIARLKQYPEAFATHWVRISCGSRDYEAVAARLNAGLLKHPPAPVINADLNKASVLDLSPGSGKPSDPFNGDMPDPTTSTSGGAIAIGGYGEPRLVYQAPAFRDGDHPAHDARTVHMGVDVFAPAGTDVFTPLDAVVHALDNRSAQQDYGPVVVLKHAIGNDTFYTLYGHLDSECLKRLRVGQELAKGSRLARIGARPENGDWPPHLHFQWVLADFDWGCDINGVCYSWDWDAWRQIFPDPAALLGCTSRQTAHAPQADDDLKTRRDTLLGGNLSVAYAEPVQVVRGFRQYLYDQYGRCYLDAYNNVPHVGHCHPHVTQAITRQLRTLSTNTRYLHNTILAYAEALTAKFSERLSVSYFVNSASEANELALRLARSYTQARDMIVIDDAYHGHTTSLIDISPYKAEGRGGSGCPDWVHKVPAVDLYRGAYRYDEPNAGALYARDVKAVIDHLNAPLCAFICESLPSVGGQLVYPQGYLKPVYQFVRDAGGVCIADEVQTGFGRTGDFFWGFEQQQVDPDIVVLGKPIGNGFPLAAVVTTPDIAASFDNGMEFFSTFGGNTVACAAGLAVLEVVEREQVQSHIKQCGDYLIKALRTSLSAHPLVGDIRGMGLFLGVELVSDKVTQTPATAQAAYVKNRLREEGVLIGTDGPYDNVLKIRPPSPFNVSDADFLTAKLAYVLNDTCLRP